MIDWTADLALALELADHADALTMQRFTASDLVVETKPDLTPVSDADKAAEALLRAQVEIGSSSTRSFKRSSNWCGRLAATCSMSPTHGRLSGARDPA